MKDTVKKLLIYAGIVLAIFVAIFFIVDELIMPSVVASEVHVLPDVEKMTKEAAIAELEKLNLNPVVEGPRYDESIPKDHVIFQNPRPGTKVKENRRIYIYISGGDPLITMPALIGKTVRDATVTLQRLGLELGEIESVRSEFPKDLIISQSVESGVKLAKGDSVFLKMSVGPQVGMVRVPNLIGEMLSSAEKKLRENSLRLGNVTYEASNSLLPNTIMEQYPSKDELVPYGDSVDVFVARTVE